jgi:hypothetical protein
MFSFLKCPHGKPLVRLRVGGSREIVVIGCTLADKRLFCKDCRYDPKTGEEIGEAV